MVVDFLFFKVFILEMNMVLNDFKNFGIFSIDFVVINIMVLVILLFIF